MNQQLEEYFDNTKQLHIFLCIALLLIIIIMVAPIGRGYLKQTGELIIIVILIYILLKNFTETHNYVLREKNKNTDMKNNTIASYVLCLFILLLLLYVIYSAFF
jgi:uncharacterized membrane protein